MSIKKEFEEDNMTECIYRNVTIRHVARNANETEESHKYLIFIDFDGDPVTAEDAEKLTKETGIPHKFSKLTKRIYVIAKLHHIKDEHEQIRDDLKKVLTDGNDYFANWVHIYRDSTFVIACARERDDTIKPPICPKVKYTFNFKGISGIDVDDTTAMKEKEGVRIMVPNPVFIRYTIGIKNIIFSGNRTIVFWTDNTKTIVKCNDNDKFDPEKGIAMALMKKTYGSRHQYMKVIGKYISKFYKKSGESS